MPSVKFTIDARGAEQGAQRFSRAIDRVVIDARRAAVAVGTFDVAMRNIGRSAATVSPGIARITGSTQAVQQSVKGAQAELSRFTVAMRDMGGASVLAFGPLSGVGARITALGGLATRGTLAIGGMVAGVTGLGVALTASVRAAANFEEGMLQVAKVTDASNAELQKMSADILRLSSTLGVPTAELATIEERAAQLGIRGSANLSTFTEQVAILTRTTDLGAEQAAAALGRFINLTNATAQDLPGIAAALVDLGNKFNATESEILSITEELSRAGTAFNVGADQLLALGAGLAAVGERSERSATAVSQALIRITEAASGGGEELQRFAGILKISEEEFQRLAAQDIGEIFLKLLGVLRDAGPQATQILKELEIGSQRNTKVFLSLAQSLDQVRDALGFVNEQFANPLAALAEFERLNDGVNRQIEKVQTNLSNLATILGSALLPPLNSALVSLNNFLLKLQGIDPAVQAQTKSLQELAAEISKTKIAVDTLKAFTTTPLGFTDTNLGDVIIDIKTLNAAQAERDLNAVSAAANVISGSISNVNEEFGLLSEKPRTIAAALDALAASAETAAASVANKTGRAVQKVLGDLRQQIELREIELTQGKAAAETQRLINTLQEEGAKEGAKVSDEQRSEIEKLVQTNLDLEKQLNAVGKAATGEGKAIEKAATDGEKAFESLSESLDDVIRELENELELRGLDEGQRAVVELTQKIEELRDKAVAGGADEAAARALANAALAEAISLKRENNALDAEEARKDILDNLQREIDLRRIAATEGEAAAEAQRRLNELTDQGIGFSDEYAAQVRAGTEALEEFENQSTVVADAFEEFIVGIARGTQELNLDGIADAFKSAFAASLAEKLEFDKLFKGNLFDLVGFAGKLFSGGAIDIGGLFSFGGAGGNLFGSSGLLGSFGLGGIGNLLLGNLGAVFGGIGGTFASGGNLGLGAGLAFGGFAADQGLKLLLTNSETAFKAAELLFGEGGTAALIGAGVSDLGTSLGSLADIGVGIAIRAAGGAIAGAIGNEQTSEGALATQLSSTVIEIVGNIFGAGFIGSIFAAINDIIDPFIHDLFGVFQPPTKGTQLRRGAESVLDSLDVFAELQETLGDLTRSEGDAKKGSGGLRRNFETGINTAFERGFTDEALANVAGFASVFASLSFEGNDIFGDDAIAQMLQASQQLNILAEFFSRAELNGEEFSEFTREQLLAAFEEMGVDLPKALGGLNKLGGAFRELTIKGEDTFGVNLGQSLRGIATIFETELPAGVHVASLALQTMSKDGVALFGDLGIEGRETLQDLVEDAETFDQVMAGLFERGFEFDVEEFERRLSAITQSAEFLGENLDQVFDFESATAGVQAVVQSLGEEVLATVQSVSLEQLFKTTDIAASFEPVFAVLDRIDEFDLTTATGTQEFTALLGPALLEGKENLEEYIPVLQLMADNWKEIQEIIDEALAPDIFEQAALVVEEAFGGIAGSLATAIDAGIAVLEDGGTWTQATSEFNDVFASGVKESFQDAIFDAIVNATVFEPLLAKFGPAFEYVVATGLEIGFGDQRVKDALATLFDDLQSDAEQLGLAIFEIQVDSEGITSSIERAFNDAADIVVDWASDLRSSFSSAFDAAFDVLASGGSRDDALSAWTAALESGTADAVLKGIAFALAQAALLEPFIAKWAPVIQYVAAGALEHGITDPRIEAAIDEIFGPDSDFQRELDNLGPFTIDLVGKILLPDGTEVDIGGGGAGRGRPGPVIGGGGAGRQFPGAATGGVFSAGDSFIVGEAGPELVMTDGLGSRVIPLDVATANALLDGGMAGFQRGISPGGPHRGGFGAFGRPMIPPYVPPPPREADPDDERELLVQLQIDAELEEFFQSGDFQAFTEQFETSVNEAVAQGMLDAILETGPLARAIEKLNEVLTREIEKAWSDGSLSDEEIERIKQKMLELGGPIKDIVERLGPEIAELFEDLGLVETVGSELRDALGDAFRDFATSGDLDAARTALREAFYDAALDGIVSALLLEGPLADAIDGAAEEFHTAFEDAMEDGLVSEDEAARLAELGTELGEDLLSAFALLDPAVAALFDGMRDRAAEALKDAGDLVGDSLQEMLSDPENLTLDTFLTTLRESIFDSVAGGLIDAFINAAIIEGALAPMLEVISLLFEQIGQQQIAVADANAAIAEQIALMLDVLDSGAFREGIDTLLDGVRGLADQLLEFPAAAADTASSARDVSDALDDAEKNICDESCGLREETLNLGNTILDEAGRRGFVEDIVFTDIPRFAHGGIVREPMVAGIGEVPEAIIPLSRLGDDDTAETMREVRDEVRSLRRENQDLRRSIEGRPIMLEAKVGEATAVEVLWKVIRLAKDAGVDLRSALQE